MRPIVSAMALLVLVLLGACDDESAPPATVHQAASADCPAQADVAEMVRRVGAPGATVDLWAPLGKNGWLLRGGLFTGDPFALTVPEKWVVDYDGGTVRGPGQTPPRQSFSVYCEAGPMPPSSAAQTPSTTPSRAPTSTALATRGCPALSDVAGMLRRIGAPAETLNDWQPLPPNGWVLRGYPGAPFTIAVPKDWVVDYDGTPGRARGGETTPPRSEYTVYCEEPS